MEKSIFHCVRTALYALRLIATDYLRYMQAMRLGMKVQNN